MKSDIRTWEKLGYCLFKNNLVELNRAQLCKKIRQETGCSLPEAFRVATLIHAIFHPEEDM